jgi:hypothetical protein
MFTLALCSKNDVSKKDCMQGATASFDKLEPKQYELAQDTAADFGEPSFPPYTRVILEDLVESTLDI